MTLISLDRRFAAFFRSRRLQERKKHRFSRSFIHGIYVFQWPCGIIQGLCFLFERELDFKEKLDLEALIIPPGETPYIIGDSECSIMRQGQPGGALDATHGHIVNSVPRRVDRFHFRAHSKKDKVSECSTRISRSRR